MAAKNILPAADGVYAWQHVAGWRYSVAEILQDTDPSVDNLHEIKRTIYKTAMLLLQDGFRSTQAEVVVATMWGGRHGDPEVEKLKTRWILGRT